MDISDIAETMRLILLISDTINHQLIQDTNAKILNLND